MIVKLKKWFTNLNEELTRYKVVLPAENFANCPGKEVLVSLGVQVIKGDLGYRLTLFGESREGWLECAGLNPTGLSWKDEVLNTANGINQFSTPWMKKKEVIEVLEKVMPFEVASWKKSPFIKDEFRNLIVK